MHPGSHLQILSAAVVKQDCITPVISRQIRAAVTVGPQLARFRGCALRDRHIALTVYKSFGGQVTQN